MDGMPPGLMGMPGMSPPDGMSGMMPTPNMFENGGGMMMPDMSMMPNGGGMGGMPCMPSMPCGPGGDGAPGGMMMPGMSGNGEDQGGPGGMMQNMMSGMMKPMMPNPMMMMMGMMQACMSKAMQGEGGGEDGSSAPSPMLAAMCGAGNPMMNMAANPMMAGGMPSGMPGGMPGNPMMGAMSSMMGGGGPPQGGSAPAAIEAPKKPAEDAIDPEVKELGEYFNIEDRWVKRLNETMKKRKATKEQDIAKLYEVLERARSPTGLLTVKIGEMECGQFVGKVKPDKDVERLARKFKLDDHVASRLTELVVRRRATKEEDLDRIEQHLRYCKRPSAIATLLASKLLEGEMDSLPDMNEAEKIMENYKLDEDACSKLREIVERRAQDKELVLAKIRKFLDTATYPSSMLCKIARPLIDGDTIPEPPEIGNKRRDLQDNNNRGGGGGGGDHRGGDRGGGDHHRGDRGGDHRGDHRGGDRDRRDRSRDRDYRRRDR